MEALANKIDIEEIRHLLSITYTTISHLGEREEGRYIQHIVGELFLIDERAEKQSKVGTIDGYKILLRRAIDNHIDPFNVFDMETDVFYLGETIYDFQEKDLDKKILAHFGDQLSNIDLLVLDHIELDPEYRGHSLGKLLVKDFYNNFISGSGLFIAFFGVKEANDKIMFYFNRMGFEIIPNLSNHIMFLNPDLINASFDEIVLE